MSDKPVAMLSAILLVAPLCSVCILGPTVVGVLLVGWFGWLTDLSPLKVIVTAIAGSALLLGIFRYRQPRETEAFILEYKGRS